MTSYTRVRRILSTGVRLATRIARFALPTFRDIVTLVASFMIGATVLWYAGGPVTAQGPGDSMLFADGQIFAPTVRSHVDGLPDRLGRGLSVVAGPLIPTRDITELGDQWEVRSHSLQAVTRLTGEPPLVPVASTKSREIHGASSGLAWAIASLQLSQPNIAAGRTIAASATLLGEGSVGPVAGLEFKVRSDPMSQADILFVFHRQVGEARGWFDGLGYRPVVIGVSNLGEAASVLCTLAGPGPVCSPLGSPRTGVTVDLPPDVALCLTIRVADLPVRCSTDSRRTTLRSIGTGN